MLERGWLSSNNIVIVGERHTALVDSGYCSHASQTLALVAHALQGRALDTLVNTHLHSDHCGGNAALQAAYPALQTLIPPGHAALVQAWDAHALSYTPTGQQCPQFELSATLQPGTSVRLGDLDWQVHAAPGHDPHSVILFEPQSRTLISADALWERGFGVVFPELDGAGAFNEVAATLDLIESLQPALVVPGHGAPFTAVALALQTARQRLAGFVAQPAKHRLYAAKVLLKFKLLEAQAIERAALLQWAGGTPYFAALAGQTSAGQIDVGDAIDGIIDALVRSGAATVQGTQIFNA